MSVRFDYIRESLRLTMMQRTKLLIFDDYLVDARKLEFRDELSRFAKWYMNNGNSIPLVPQRDSQHFDDRVSGLVLYRKGNFQVQLFLSPPDRYIPDHIHPNVDSYEVGLRGMEFRHSGEVVMNMKESGITLRNGLSLSHGSLIRVLPCDVHGALSSPDGGAFLSIQHWLDGIKPTSIGNNWKDCKVFNARYNIKRNKGRV